MLITELKGNIHESPISRELHLERVFIPGDQLVKRIQRVRTDHDREVGIRLPAGSPDLKDGDILHMDDQNAIVVQVEPTDVIVIKPRTVQEMGFVAHSLGNRHLQAQFFGIDSEYQADVMVVLYDHTVVQFLDAVEALYERQKRVMPTPFRHSEHTH